MKNNSYLEVQSILDKRTNEKGAIEFLIHWRGYAHSYDSWEPLKNLTMIKELISIYESTRLETDPDYLIEDEVQTFIANDDDDNTIDEKRNDYLPKLTDIPLKIISLSKHKEEIYALIEWQVRYKTGIKPKNSYINTTKLKKDKNQLFLYLNYLETKIIIFKPHSLSLSHE